jgi:lysophospholipase L1-like esterase
MPTDEAREVLTGKPARAIGIAVAVFVGLWFVRDPTDAIWGAPGSGLELFRSFAQQGAPVLGGAQGTASGPDEERSSGERRPAAGQDVVEDGEGVPSVRSSPAALVDPEGRGLAHFQASLRAGGLTRVLHYGDSLIDTDFVVGTARRLLQARFGDGGHGFLNVGKPWEWYRHWDVVHSVRGSWSLAVATHSPARDGRYGLGGARFRPRGGVALFGTATEGEHGRKASRFEVAYAEHPQGGTLVISADGREERVSTEGPAHAVAWKQIRVPDGRHTFELRGAGDRDVLLYGVTLERDRGVVYDNLGINGARARILADFDEATWAAQLRHREPDLVILGFGLNEAENEHFPAGRWPELVKVVERLRRAVPEASCMLLGPPDRVDREGSGSRSRPVVRRITNRQRDVAREHGCAFFDLQAAMGGEGAAARWARQRPRLVAGDLTHVTPEGADRIGQMLVEALTAGM